MSSQTIRQIGKFFSNKSKLMNSEKARYKSFEVYSKNNKSDNSSCIQILAILGFYCVNEKNNKSTSSKRQAQLKLASYTSSNVCGDPSCDSSTSSSSSSSTSAITTLSITEDAQHNRAGGGGSSSSNTDSLHICCYFCGAQRTVQSGDNMLMLHNLNCTLIDNETYSGNIELGSGRLKALLSLNCNNAILLYYRSDIEIPAYPLFKKASSRFDTFKNWPLQMKQKPEEFAKLGLFYSGEGDCVICFQCGRHFANWRADDDIIARHKLDATDCYFFEKMLYLDVDRNVTKRCLICEDEPINTLILPCSHCMTCITCTDKLLTCPICRREILDTITFFY